MNAKNLTAQLRHSSSPSPSQGNGLTDTYGFGVQQVVINDQTYLVLLMGAIREANF
jgi:hypothetical protein